MRMKWGGTGDRGGGGGGDKYEETEEKDLECRSLDGNPFFAKGVLNTTKPPSWER